MNDLYTLLSLRDDVYAAYENAKKHDSMRHQWSGLLATLNILHKKIQEATDERNAHMDLLEAQAGG